MNVHCTIYSITISFFDLLERSGSNNGNSPEKYQGKGHKGAKCSIIRPVHQVSPWCALYRMAICSTFSFQTCVPTPPFPLLLLHFPNNYSLDLLQRFLISRIHLEQVHLHLTRNYDPLHPVVSDCREWRPALPYYVLWLVLGTD